MEQQKSVEPPSSPDARRLEKLVSIGASKTLRVAFAPVERQSSGSMSSPPAVSHMSALGKVWQRKVLQDLQDGTHFSSTELRVLLNHFSAHCDSGDDKLDRETFFGHLSRAFGSLDQRLLQHIYTAMDESGRGWVSFRQFACALSTVFRGEKEDVLDFWFRMYDTDRDGFLRPSDFQQLLADIHTSSRKSVQVQVEQVFAEAIDDEDAPEGAGGAVSPEMLLSFDEFRAVMEEHDVVPMFLTPHKFARHKQLPALRNLSPAEREVVLLLGSDVRPAEGELLINYDEKATHFYFVMEGEVALERSGITLQRVCEGEFLGEAALFEDIKAKAEDGSTTFTTAARVVSDAAHVLALDIRDLYPLVYHEHPGATAIVQRLGRIMLERIQQTEARLQSILASQAPQSAAGVRMSSKDWAAFRKRLTKQWALKYHKIGRKGKLEIMPTKAMGSKEDLSVAYSPGVAEPCLSIQHTPDRAYDYTAKGHLVGVITNGTAVLGLGNIGPLAGKPVMEGKAVLFKKFADLDAFDIEVNEMDPKRLVDIVVALEPTFGGINLEDIRSPECFYVERECQRRMNIPVFHDDQHGTAIVAGAGLINAMDLVGKEMADVRVAVCGCGAAGYSCAKQFLALGIRKENLIAVDVKGVVYAGREDITPDNYLYDIAADTDKRTLKEAVDGADVFLGLSAGNLLTPEMLATMAREPVVFACANPVPEIDPDLAAATRPDVIMATGRSDFPNQINNVCVFPHIFRGALDCRARRINEEMKLAATYAIAAIARRPASLKKRTPSMSDLSTLVGGAGAGAGAENGANGTGMAAAPSSGLSEASSACAAAGVAASVASCSTSVGADGPPARAPSPASGRSGSPGPGHRRRKSLLQGKASEEAPAEDVATTPAFGRDYIIPRPFDDRLAVEVAAAVVQAAIDTGVARITNIDMAEYKRNLADLTLRLNL